MEVTGTGFKNSIADNTVVVGKTKCDVSEVKDQGTKLVCTLLPGNDIGPVDVHVTVKERGLAKGSATFTFEVGVDNSISTSGSVQGRLIFLDRSLMIG